MIKIRKLGATALALALSLTMVAPIGANAAYKDSVYESFSGKYSGQITAVQDIQIKENKDADGRIVSYTDITTGQTAAEAADLIDYTVPKKVTIPVKEWTLIHVKLGNGNCEVKKVKSSSKGTIKAKLCKEYTVINRLLEK